MNIKGFVSKKGNCVEGQTKYRKPSLMSRFRLFETATGNIKVLFTCTEGKKRTAERRKEKEGKIKLFVPNC